MLAALRLIRKTKPQKLIVAIGVAPEDSLARLKNEADEVVCLLTPSWFMAVGQHFTDFPQVSDEEVVEMLTR
jgi:putative phosphoribosyl transferase